MTGATTSSQLFDVTPGGSTDITIGGLPSGAVTVNELAFAVPCAQVTTGTLATWVAQQPVMATLVPGQATAISIVLRRAGQLSISNDFEDGASGLTIAPSSQSFGNVVVGAVGTASPARSPPPCLSPAASARPSPAPASQPSPWAPSPPAQSFGNVMLGRTATATLTVSNSGTGSAPFSTAITGTNAAAFTRTGGSCATLASLAAGASCTLTVQFAPTALRTATATLSVGSLASAALTGVGVSALTASPAQVSFGNLNVGQNTSNSVNITNGGTAAVAFSSSITSTNAAEFTRTGGSCATLASLAAGASCSLTIRFAPTATGPRTATLSIGSPTQITVPLTGTGL